MGVGEIPFCPLPTVVSRRAGPSARCPEVQIELHKGCVHPYEIHEINALRGLACASQLGRNKELASASRSWLRRSYVVYARRVE
jgi:hypothetical protein